MPVLGDERAESLPSENDALALQFLVGALDGDDADEQILGEVRETTAAPRRA